MRVMVFLHGTAIMHAAEGCADVARRAGADVIVKDDCVSIGGRAKTTAVGLAGSPSAAGKLRNTACPGGITGALGVRQQI